MPVSVTKADGAKQLFDKEKVVRTCLRMGATRKVAEVVAERIEANVYEGIETSRILQMIFKELRKFKPAVKHHTDLRRALSLMKSKPDFEQFIRIVLDEHGYEVTPNQIIRGKCVEHEVDAMARKDGETYFVEVKHHFNYHTPTGLDVSRIARAVLEDFTEGFKLGLNSVRIDKAMIVCNTKFSGHAKRYAECRGIQHIGWNSPLNNGLQTLIGERKLYPITYLKGLKTTTIEKLASAGVILLRQLLEENPRKLRRIVGIPEKNLRAIIENARVLVA